MPHPLPDGTFAEALVTRICHDLAGPIGAFGNGIELLGEEGDPAMQSQARVLLALSAQEGMARLQLYRIAFGQLKDGIPAADVEETRQIARRFLARSPVTLDWPEGEKAGFRKDIAMPLRQVLGGMVLVTAGFLPFGGTLSVRHHGKKRTLAVTGSHTRLREDKTAVAALSGAGEDTPAPDSPYNIIPRFLAFSAYKSGLDLRCAKTETNIELIAEYPNGM